MTCLKCCKYYDKIVNFLYLENDIISELLINYYRDYVFNIKSEKSKIRIDKIMNLYTEKEEFYKYIQRIFNLEKNNEIYDNYEKLMRKLLKLYSEFEKINAKKIKNSRWL